MRGEPVDRAGGEGDGALLALVGEQFRTGQARGVIDGDVDLFPAGAALVALAGSIAGDAMADAADATKLLDVDVDQFAGLFPFTADDLGWWIKRRQSTQPPAAQGDTDGSRRGDVSDALWPGQTGVGGGVVRSRFRSRRSAGPGRGAALRWDRPSRQHPRRHAGHATCTVFGVTPRAAATDTTDQPWDRRSMINIRLSCVVRAFRWMSIRGSRIAVVGVVTTASIFGPGGTTSIAATASPLTIWPACGLRCRLGSWHDFMARPVRLRRGVLRRGRRSMSRSA
jgi:hypothetical protein